MYSAFKCFRYGGVDNSSFPFLLLLVLLLVSGCSKKEETPVDPLGGAKYTYQLKLNGDGFDNVVYTNFNSSGFGVYDSRLQGTILTVNGKNGSQNVTVTILSPGRFAGTFSWVNYEEPNVVGSVYVISGNSLSHKTWVSKADQGTIKITSYANYVGESISGEVSGNLVSQTTANTLNISGSFSVTRMADSN